MPACKAASVTEIKKLFIPEEAQCFENGRTNQEYRWELRGRLSIRFCNPTCPGHWALKEERKKLMDLEASPWHEEMFRTRPSYDASHDQWTAAQWWLESDDQRRCWVGLMKGLVHTLLC